MNDLKMDDAERARLKALMGAQGGDGDASREMLNETHVFVTADGEKDQAQVQTILKDTANYLTGKGRWCELTECCSCGCALDENWRAERQDPTGCTSCGGIARNYNANSCGHTDPNSCTHCGKAARYYDHRSIDPFLIPCHLLRVGKVGMKQIELRASRSNTNSEQRPRRFELSVASKTEIYEWYRVRGD